MSEDGKNATFKKGDKVTWKSHGGEAHGTVEKKQTGPMDIKGHHVAATKEDPQYVVKTEKGSIAAHKPGALKKD